MTCMLVRGWGTSAVSLVVVVGLAVLGLAGPARPAHAQGPWDAQSTASTFSSAFSLRIDLLSLNRPSAEAVVATLRVTNLGTEDQHLGLVLGTQDDIDSAAGFALLDASGRKAYFPLYAGDGKCVCSLFDRNLAAGGTRNVFVWFPAPPADIKRLSVLVPHAPPFLGVPIGSHAAPVPAPSGQPARDPAQLNLRPPRVQDLVSVTDALDKSKTVEEDDEEKRVRLSADVLFKLNKANLTPKAREVLREVAKEIENSDAKVVHIDGHTDSSGGPLINIPLSKRRAESVRDALATMVDRDVRFDAEGHGASQPVATNKTREGRRLNRRVTVRFAT